MTETYTESKEKRDRFASNFKNNANKALGGFPIEIEIKLACLFHIA